MAVIPGVRAVVSERQEATVIRVANLRGEPVGPGVVGHELEHPAQAFPILVGQATRAERVGRTCRTERTAR